MSTSLLYHAFGIRGYHETRIEFVGGKVVFHVTEADDQLSCGKCGSDRVWRRGSNATRTFTSLPIGFGRTEIVLAPARGQCLDCGAIQQVKITFTVGQRSYTRKFERYVADLCRTTTLKYVAKQTGLNWGTVKEIHKRSLKRSFQRPRLKDLTSIGIDEIHVGRHKFKTIVLDLISGAIVYEDDGRGGDSLKSFWRRLRLSGADVKSVAIDMSPAYTKAVTENCPMAAIVYDRFHVIKLMNEKLSAVRRSIQRKASEEDQKVLKGTRWLLLKNPENLVKEKGEAAHLEKALAANVPLATAYYLKEDLHQFWEQGSKAAASKFLAGWIERAKASGIRILKSFAKTLTRHTEGLLAYFDHFITTGPLEGTNNKIKTLLRQCYGLRDQEYFRMRLYSLHQTSYQLIG